MNIQCKKKEMKGRFRICPACGGEFDYGSKAQAKKSRRRFWDEHACPNEEVFSKLREEAELARVASAGRQDYLESLCSCGGELYADEEGELYCPSCDSSLGLAQPRGTALYEM